MKEVDCLYCGNRIPNDSAHCPHCGAVSHFQERGYRSGVRKRFIIFFIGLVLFCLFFAFYLPR
ncbi:MAG: protein nirD [Sedimenticola sp.]|nr:MAG: protein nirD [Sedimenticola sp.]